MEKKSESGTLLMFYGTECTHCHEMEPLVKQLEAQKKLNVERLEVWHNAKNAKLLEKYDTVDCGGVPFFYNTKTKKSICGATSYEKLLSWAMGK